MPNKCNLDLKIKPTVWSEHHDKEKDSKQDVLWQQREWPVLAQNKNKNEETLVDTHNTCFNLSSTYQGEPCI